jgi:hypothetical protein
MADAASRAKASPLLSLLALGNFVVGMGVFVVIGIVSPIAEGLGISTADAGLVLTAYAIAYALLSPIGAALTGSLPRRTRVAAIAAILVVWGAGYVNYFRLAEYHNPIYAVPSRDIAARMRAEDAHTLIIAESDTLVPYYFRSAPAQAQLIEVGINTSISAVEQRIANDGPAHVEIAWFGRDRTAGGFDTPALGEWLTQHGYVETRREEYGIVGDSYLAIKSRLIGRETYRAKLTVQRFERK